MGNISKLTPILYNKGETNFNHNGLGKLTKLLANEIDEVLNGEFEAYFEYTANGRLADKIDNEMFIKAKPNKKDGPHVFKIYDYELDTFTQTYLIYARSKNIEDLRNNVILDVNVSGLAPTQAWDLAKNNALDPVVTTFYSDITTTSSVHWERRSLLSTIAGQGGSMIQYWGGEIKHGIDRISLFRRRGQDNVTTVRHGKNLDGLKATYSTKGLVTAIVPYYVKDDGNAIYGDVVESEYINNYPSTYYDIIEYNDEELGLTQEDESEGGWEDSTIRTELNRVAKRYFVENVGKDLPSINMEISLEDISQTKEYENFKDFEQIEIGDTITVYSKEFDLNINAKVRRVVYNGLTDKNELVEVGTARRSLYDDVRDEFRKVETELKEGIDHALISADGKNTNYYGTADPNEVGLVGQPNDTYFRTNGSEKEIWRFTGALWELIVDTSETTKNADAIEAVIEQAETDRAELEREITQTYEDAVTEADRLAAIRDDGITITAGQIRAGIIDAARLDAVSIVTSGLSANVVKANHIQADSALFDKLFATSLATDRLSAQQAWIKNINIADASIDGAKIQDATIGSAKIANLDAAKISTGILDGITVRSNFNYAYDGAIRNQGTTTINQGIITSIGAFTHSYGSTYMSIAPDKIYAENLKDDRSIRSQFVLDGRGITVVALGETAYYRQDGIAFPQGNAVMRYHNSNDRIEMGSNNGVTLAAIQRTSGDLLPRLAVGGGGGGIDPFVDIYTRMNMRFNQIDNVSRIYLRNPTGVFTGSMVANTSDNWLHVGGRWGTRVGHMAADHVTFHSRAEFGASGDIKFFANLNMQNNTIINNSDERLKRDIKPTTINSLSALESWGFVGFNWIDDEMNERNGRQLGVIAQDTPDLAMYDAETDTWSINSSKQIMMNSHAIQQLAFEHDEAFRLSESNEQKIHQLQQELSKANRRIEELESVI